MVPLQQPLVFCRRGHYRGRARPAPAAVRPASACPCLASEAAVRRAGGSPKGGGGGF